MTRGDFILSIVTSIGGAIVYEVGRKALVYVRGKKFRKARRRFVRNAPTQVFDALAPIYPVFPFLVRTSPITIGLLLVFGLPALLVSLGAGDPGSLAVDPFGSGLPPFDLLSFGF
jgi:hypothetical protein